MVNKRSRPYISEKDVRNALESLANPTPQNLQFDSLKALRLVENIIENPDYPAIEDRNYPVYQVLCTIIEYELAHHRALHGINIPLRAASLSVYIQHIRADHQQSASELEHWSLLYHRYVRVELNLGTEVLGEIIGLEGRSIRRRRDEAVIRLTQYLIHEETQAQVAAHRRRLLAQLPHSTISPLIGREAALKKADEIIAEQPQATLLITGARGTGKTHFTEALLSPLVGSFAENHSQALIDDLIWIESPNSAENVLDRLYDAAQIDYDAEKLRGWLLTYRVVVVVEDADHLMSSEPGVFDDLLRFLAPALTLITSCVHVPLSNLSHHILLPELSRSDAEAAMHSFYAALSGDVPGLSANEINTIYAITGGNPKAIRLIIHNALIKDLSIDTTVLDQLLENIYTALHPPEKKAWFSLALCPPGHIARQDVLKLWPDLQHEHFSALLRRYLIEAPDADHYHFFTLGRQFLASRYRRRHYEALTLLQERLQAIEQQGAQVPEFTLKVMAYALSLDWLEVDDAQRVRWAEMFSSLNAANHPPQDLQSIYGQLSGFAPDSARQYQLEINRGIALRRLAQWQQAEAVFNNLMQPAGSRGDFLIQAQIHIELSIIWRYKGAFEHALKALQRAENLVRRYNNQPLLNIIYLEMGQINIDLRSPQEALNYLNQIKDPGKNEMPRYRLMRGEIYLLLNNPFKARQEGKALLNLNIQDRTTLGQVHNLIGRSYVEEQNYDEALYHFSVAHSYFDALRDSFAIARCNSNIGAVLMQKGKYDEAWERLNHAYQTQSTLGDKLGMMLTQHNLHTLRSYRQ